MSGGGDLEYKDSSKDRQQSAKKPAKVLKKQTSPPRRRLRCNKNRFIFIKSSKILLQKNNMPTPCTCSHGGEADAESCPATALNNKCNENKNKSSLGRSKTAAWAYKVHDAGINGGIMYTYTQRTHRLLLWLRLRLQLGLRHTHVKDKASRMAGGARARKWIPHALLSCRPAEAQTRASVCAPGPSRILPRYRRTEA